jgi:hypothetical protein
MYDTNPVYEKYVSGLTKIDRLHQYLADAMFDMVEAEHLYDVAAFQERIDHIKKQIAELQSMHFDEAMNGGEYEIDN